MIQLKIIFLYLDVCILTDKLDLAVETLNFLDDQKYYIMSIFSQIPCEDKKIEKKANFYTSLIFASELSQNFDPVSLINRFEFNIVLAYFRIQIFMRLNEFQSSKQVPIWLRLSSTSSNNWICYYKLCNKIWTTNN